MTSIMIFLLGFVGYFLIRYRFSIISFVHDIFVLRSRRKQKQLKGSPVMFFELEEVWPDRKDKKAS